MKGVAATSHARAWCGCAFVCWASTALADRGATLDDAYAIRSVGAVELNPEGSMLAIEAEGGLVVFVMGSGIHRVKYLQGHVPAWSPDGRTLAYFSGDGIHKQLHVWNSRSDKDEEVTEIPGGVSPNWLATDLCASRISWAPDSERLVFATRIMGDFQAIVGNQVKTSTRVYGSEYRVSSSLLEGVFHAPSWWDTYFPGNPDLGDRMRAAEIDPKVARSHLVVVNVNHKKWSEITNGTQDYYCPSWSPHGETIAAVADVASGHTQTYFGSYHIEKSALVLFNAGTGDKTEVSVPANRVGTLDWSPDGDSIAMVAEEHPPIESFHSVIMYSRTRRKVRKLDHPTDLSVRDFKWFKGGHLIARYWDHFGNSLWEVDPTSGLMKRLSEVDLQIDSYSEARSGGAVVLNTQSGKTKGVVILARAGEKPKTIYDANPQLSSIRLGQQRRITWRDTSGEDVDGIIILPPDYQSGKRYPVIVCPYPMWAWDILWLTPEYETIGQLEAARGYIVFRPALRAPFSASWYSRGEEYTEKARGAAGIPILVDDFVTGIQYLEQQGFADPLRIGLFGHSNGGWVTNLLITETSVAKAAVVASGVSNAILLGFFPRVMTPDGKDPATGGNVFDNFGDYVNLSPIFKMRDLKIPLLLTVGDDDWLWVPQMISEYGVLRSLGKDVELVRYSGESHSLMHRADIEDALSRMNGFFDDHLGVHRVD